MEQYLTDGLVKWLSDLERERKELKEQLQTKDNELQVLMAQLHITGSAKTALSVRDGEEFEKEYIKPLEKRLETEERALHELKQESALKLRSLNALINKVKESLGVQRK